MANVLLDAVSNLKDMTRDDLDAWIEEHERPLIDELAGLDDAPLGVAARKAAKLRIAEARMEIELVRDVWLNLNREPDAGPDQQVG